ncbi:FkbM family methyltransferase [Rhizobium sp. KVB221]|uniref:FkbM family methyltransferase n=1 Tax=Rhizobium setariae TaxID=2801340 RepID=A0A936YT68_9HYPH|nr:FkbM family methyltransferase [Rhizobium setariae]MBL0374396.1 FkbM family methyltransferase [Rhizobium setariae]
MEIDFKVKVTNKLGESKEITLKLDDTNANENHILSFLRAGHSYEPDVTKIVQKILEPGDVFIDVGANVGYFTLLASTLVGPEGKVYAFEPDPKNIERITLHCANNGYDNVEIISRPASHCVEDVNFYFNKSSSGGNALWNPGEFFGDPEFNDGYSVMKSTTLSNEFTSLGLDKVKMVKIDTEGAEHAILRGAYDWLKNQSIPFIIAELNTFGLKKLDSSTEQLIDYMYTQGYLAFLLYFDGRSPQFICPGVDIHTAVISNILFTTPAGFSKIWPVVQHNPGVEIDKDTGKMRIAA